MRLIDHPEPTQYNCLEIDNILLSPSIAAMLLALIFSYNYWILEASMTPCLTPAPYLNRPEMLIMIIIIIIVFHHKLPQTLLWPMLPH